MLLVQKVCTEFLHDNGLNKLTSPDVSLPFPISCDASSCGLGSVLTQIVNSQERVIAFASCTLSRAERIYSVGERENALL